MPATEGRRYGGIWWGMMWLKPELGVWWCPRLESRGYGWDSVFGRGQRIEIGCDKMCCMQRISIRCYKMRRGYASFMEIQIQVLGRGRRRLKVAGTVGYGGG